MANRITFPTGIQSISSTWVASTYKYLLLNSGATDPDPSTAVYVADISANEAVAGGYARQTVTTKSVVVVLPATADDPGYVQFQCDSPSFGILTGGENETWLVLFQDSGSDATSVLVSANLIAYVADGSTTCLIGLSSNGAVSLSTICPDGF